jgi:hypothetical protein
MAFSMIRPLSQVQHPRKFTVCLWGIITIDHFRNMRNVGAMMGGIARAAQLGFRRL